MAGLDRIIRAVCGGDAAALEAALEAGGGVGWATWRADTGKTALHLAAERTDGAAVLGVLLKHLDKEHIDAQESFTRATSLHICASRGHKDMVAALLGAGASVNVGDDSGRTPLHWAAFQGHGPCISELLAAGAEVNTAADWKRTPLHVAAAEGHLEAVKLLVRGGAKVNAQTVQGYSPLWFAALNNHTNVVPWLINSGKADSGIRDRRGRSLRECQLLSGPIKHAMRVADLCGDGEPVPAPDAGEGSQRSNQDRLPNSARLQRDRAAVLKPRSPQLKSRRSSRR